MKYKNALLKVIGILVKVPTPLSDEQLDQIERVLYWNVSVETNYKHALIGVLRIVDEIQPIEMGPRNQDIYLEIEKLLDPDVSVNPTPWAVAHRKDQDGRMARYERAFMSILNGPGVAEPSAT